ncbi:hypothetical protein MPAR162_21735 [Methylorubrum populi]|uniref:AAA family ATPase n=1 Tax=Methylorubrum populi TaxID=223967 RepID=UPI002F346BB9
MRILAIRGENLASLAAPFAVDLAAEPLGATGLFAITGETGAGKSTILDALCLALYGRYPRVAVSRREDVPDPGGEALSASDGRAILRRGAGAGFAEVDFVGRDGVAYRVGWEAYRARNRATGKLQAERRRLHRLDDGSAVAAGKTAVLEKVVELTDLNFDQFRRTVLLAQGEFDAFLLAAEGERAELLEKITGTAIYSEISKRVHLGYEEHRRAVEALEMRRQEIGLLNEDGVKARDTERAERLAQVAAWDAEQEAVGRILETARRIETARTALAQAEQRAAATREVSAAAASDRTHLADLDAVEPLRGRVEALNEVGRERQAARAAVEAVRVRVTAAQGRADACEATRAEASAADEAAETVFKSFGPVWDRAAALDAAVTHAEQEAAGAGQAASRAAEAEETARIALIAEAAGAAAAAERADARYAATDAAFTQACGARGREAVSALLALPPEARTALRARLDRLSREESEAATALATRRADLDALRSEVEIDVAAARAESARLSEAIAEAQQRLGALDAELRRDEAARAKAADLAGQIETARAELSTWHRVEEAIGSAGGDRFRRFAQGVTLDHLVHLANEQLRALSPRYRLARSAGADLALHVVDRDMGDERRATRSLSGGERFLVSLALALALSGLEGRQSFVDTLFIDEGFGSLDAETLDLAVDALETLQGRGRKVGVITHVAGMMERIAVQIRVEKRGSGRSVVRVVDRGTALA